MVVAASRNHLYRRRLQVVIGAGPRNHLYLLGQQVKIRSSPRNQYLQKNKPNLIAGTKTSSSLAIVARRPVDHNLKGEEHSNRLSIDYPTNGANPAPATNILP